MPDETSEMSSNEYERLVQNIHKVLLNADGKYTIDVKHNVRIADTFGQEHQIDVFWRFEMGGIEYRTAIECKRYTRPVSKSYVATFATVLRQIGNINGIMVTSAGFQSGAEELALNNGIKLVIARSPTEEDLEGIVQTIELHIHTVSSQLSVSPDVSGEWISNRGINIGHQMELSTKDSPGVFDIEGKLVQSWDTLCHAAIKDEPAATEEGRTTTYRIEMQDKFLKHPKYGLLPITAVNIIHSTMLINSVVRVEAPNINSYVMRDIKSGETRWLYGPTDSLRLTPAEAPPKIPEGR